MKMAINIEFNRLISINKPQLAKNHQINRQGQIFNRNHRDLGHGLNVQSKSLVPLSTSFSFKKPN